MNENAFQRMVDPIKRKIALSLARMIVKVVQDDKDIQRMQVEIFKDELRDSVERFQDYGFTSKPHPGAEGLIAFLGGDRSHGIIVKVDDRRYRLQALEDGEVALYTDEGDKIHFKRDRHVEIVAGTKLTITAPDTEITGNLNVKGNIDCDQEINDDDGTMGEMRQTYNSHTHPENDNGGPTGVPNQPMT